MITTPTLEEAWKLLNYVGAQIEERSAARALAQASHQATVFEHRIECDDSCMAMRRIEALGSDEGGQDE